MLTMNQRLQLREQEVASKVIDGEAIIINLANGIYYSMDKTGALIWEMIQDGHTLHETLDALTSRYDVPREQAHQHLEQLVEELINENLISVADDGVVGSNPPTTDVLAAPEHKAPYELPKLNIYRDMGDLLALDPPTPGLGDTPWKDPAENSSR